MEQDNRVLQTESRLKRIERNLLKSFSRRAGHRRPVFFLALAAIVAAAACYSSDYGRTMAANVALLSDLSDKLADYCRSDFMIDDRQISSEEMGEFYYASDFHSEPEPSLVPARHFTAGAPRGIFLSLSSNLGGAS